MAKQKREITHVFIDSQNFYKSIKSMGWKPDEKKFYRYLKDKYRINKAYYAVGYIKSKEYIYRRYKNAGFILHFKEVDRSNPDRVKGNVDIDLTVLAMHELFENQFDQAVLVTGDGDFYALAKYLEDRGKLKKIICPRRKSASQLLIKHFKHRIEYLNGKRGKIGK